jgi:hypothetical protein
MTIRYISESFDVSAGQTIEKGDITVQPIPAKGPPSGEATAATFTDNVYAENNISVDLRNMVAWTYDTGYGYDDTISVCGKNYSVSLTNDVHYSFEVNAGTITDTYIYIVNSVGGIVS